MAQARSPWHAALQKPALWSPRAFRRTHSRQEAQRSPRGIFGSLYLRSLRLASEPRPAKSWDPRLAGERPRLPLHMKGRAHRRHFCVLGQLDVSPFCNARPRRPGMPGLVIALLSTMASASQFFVGPGRGAIASARLCTGAREQDAEMTRLCFPCGRCYSHKPVCRARSRNSTSCLLAVRSCAEKRAKETGRAVQRLHVCWPQVSSYLACL